MLNQIVKKSKLAPGVYEFYVENPIIAAKAQPGQFVVVIPSEKGERVPLTIADAFDGNIRMVVKVVGKSTADLALKREGETLYGVVGPLGKPSEIKYYGNVLLVGGGVGIAAILPIAKALKALGNKVYAVLGGRSKDQVILKDELEQYVDEILVTTDDGSFGIKGVVTDGMDLILRKQRIDIAWAIGPTIMMKFCSLKAREYGLKIVVSLNPIMVDGTGMCGACRVTINGQIKFACVDGPEFDGTQVDWDELLKRLQQYQEQEKLAFEKFKQKVGDLSWL
ncbi:sulfide/dihydroorotate dehydrogenase-like FAD/NAD-binding protein [Pseudothermotoga thermarum]|uniref:Sulfide dehydrogenase (Flavoprotein) subunit SudB n=1 Tax=Pseudothermotoga thermarum DSM 5069 TaxID=688269 RepID=F7YY76_9THEM|nr:sulfide/dihydroorotate dehydrogenase-like FAD/NAD-binding protein [Pseudothermotoga thermarum]AEH50897.1 sulfide dehydrogenase (flavoprotein) subunit SudB [Pseudothermotoga thermarum DSM 5069]